MNVEVISKATGAITEVARDAIDLDAPSIVRLDITRAQVAGFEQQGADLLIRLVDGETIRIVDFYPPNATVPNDLVLRENDGSLWLAKPGAGTPRFSLIQDLDDLVAAHGGSGGSSLAIPALLGGLAAAAGIAAIASGSGGDDDARPSGGQEPDPGTPAPDRDPPAAPTGAVRGDGAAVVGRGEAGATVSIRNAAGAVIGTAVVAADGSYTATVAPPQVNGERLTITQADPAGNVSPATPIQAPDITAPAAPTAAIDATGTTITGRGEAGATVTIRDASGAVLGTGTIAADGTYAVTLSTPQANGGTLSVTQTDAAGNVSPATSTTAPDVTAPAAPTAVIAGDGAQVSGRGEPGARVTIRGADGAILATATVGADGAYTAPLSPAQRNGEPLSVTQADAAGNASPATTVTAPDLTAPAAPVATINGDGTTLSGRGEAGARVEVRNAGGTVIGSTTVAADGSYTVTLSPAQANGGTVSVVQTDAAGNASPATSLAAPDITAPAAPVATINGDGTLVTGTGEPGGRVTVTGPAGTPIGTAVVGPDGSYTVTLLPAQANGGTVSIVQTDAAGNASPATSLTAPDITAPAAPVATISGDGTVVTGTGEPGGRVTVTNPAGTPIGTAVVGPDGSYTVTLSPPQADGGTLTVTQVDPAGNASPPTAIAAPDITAPAAPTIAIDATGTQVSGSGQPGARVTITDPAGATIGTAVVAANGSYSATLTTPQVNGERVDARQADGNGNASGIASTIAPDLTAPAQPTATINADGTVVTGAGEPGARITVTDTAGTVLGSAIVAADGTYSAPLTPAQADGEALRVIQVDAAGNAAPPLPLTAPDITAPPAPLATLDATGTVVSGTGEPGARVAVVDASGTQIGSATVTAQGGYAVVLATPQVNSQILTVTQSDAAGNASPAVPLTAPDRTAPVAPTATVAADGTSIAGTGEPGATVTVRSPLGAVIATTTVAADGSYGATLTPAQTDGEVLAVRQADAAGNVSPSATATAPDLVVDSDPPAPTASVSADGAAVTGVAIGGATITLYDANGNAIGTGTANPDGSYSVALAPPRIDGETVRVTQTEADGDVSPPASAIAPDLTPPAAPAATLDGTGGIVTGTGEAGAVVTVRAADGTILGTATVAAGGAYAVVLATAQANGGTLSVTQADAAGNVSPATSLAAPDLTAPAAPAATVAADGTAVTGTGEPGTIATVRDATGTVIGSAPVAADGRYAVPLAPVQANGETVSVTLADAAGNVSPPTSAVAPDITAPAAPTLSVGGDGTSVAGTGEPGATVTITSPAGATIGTAVVAADGRYTATISPAQINGERLGATQADAAGNVSGSTDARAPDLVAPAAPTATINGDGTIVSGTGEPGATVTITGPAGAAIGSAAVAADGSYAVTLAPAQANGETLSVTQRDPAGNASPNVGVTAPDVTAPAAPTAIISGDGATVSGTGEAGATITVRNAAGTAIGTTTVAANGSYTATLTPAQANGEALTVGQADAAGNVSPLLPLTAPDITAPPAPAAALDPTGTIVSGTGEAGATVTVRAADGTSLGTAIVTAQGSYSVTLTTPQVDSQALRVTQADAVGNVSPATPLTAPDLTAPAAPTASVAADGLTLTGTGEAGATVTVRNPLGVAIGTATVAADGRYTVTLATAQTDGETLSVRQADAAGNVSPAVSATAPDLVVDTDPAAPTATVGTDGASVAGAALGGATITVYTATGMVIATGTANPDGSYSVALSPPQVNGETVRVTQTEADGDVSPPATAIAPDLTAPIAPTATLDATGGVVTGTGEAGATVVIRGPGGATLGTATVAANGAYAATLTPAQTNGETLTVTQADAAGNVSPPATALAPDLVAPLAPTATVSTDGTTVTGRGEAGARIVILDPAGTPIGVATVAADGSYSATLSTPQVDGERLTATQTDGGGNASPAVVAVAPDLTAPAIPTLAIASDGTSAGGVGEPGATVTLTGPGRTIVGTAPVAADGSYTIALAPPRVNGEAFTATQADAAGNASPAANAVAPDLTAPAAPTAGVDATGTTVTGTGEAGATVRVTGPGGALGSALVAADGSYTITLTTPQANGQALLVTQADPAGNVSPATGLAAPDITAPAAPTATVSTDGASVTGTGEAGATVTITAPGGAVIGTALVAANGSYTAVLTVPQTNGELLGASQRDPAGNPSPVAPALAPDSTAPATPVAAVSADGGFVTGTGEAGATVTVAAAGGAILGTAAVAADGSYSVRLDQPQTDGQTLAVTQRDAAGNVSPPAAALAPDTTAPLAPTATVTPDGGAVVGTGVPGGRITVTGPAGTPIGTAIVAADGSYVATLDVAQRNGERLGVVQADTAGNASPSIPALAPDLTAPAAPTATVGSQGDVVTGLGEPGATVTITGPGNAILGTAVVGGSGSYLVTLATPQRNGEALVATQRDAAGNLSGPTNAPAPDLTAPPPPASLTVSGDGTALTGTGEPGARVEVRAGGVLLGTATVATDGSFSVPLSPVQLTGATVSATQADVAGNVSGAATAVAPFDIQAFGNTDTASIDIVPVTTNVNAGSANYVALVALGLVNLQAQVLAIPNVQFTVAAGHSLDATFTYDGLLTLGLGGGYAVVVQRFDGTNWVAVNGTAGGTLLELGLLSDNLVATETLGPGSYRAFVTFDGGLAGIGVLGDLIVNGRDSDFTDIQSVVPQAGSGNVITDPGPGGAVDVVSAATRVDSVTHNGIVTAVTGNGTIVDGDWGTLVINTDGSYTYTPDANAAAIGRTDVFTYTLIDPSDNERESASLSITIGSGDIAGAPLAVNDAAISDVTYRNVEVVAPPVTAFTYNTGVLGGSGNSGFTVQANTTADVTIVARTDNLALLPTYNLIVRDAGNAIIRNVSVLSVVSLGNTVPTATFVLDDLPAGTYSYSVSSGTAVLGFGSTVSLGTTTTLLDRFELAMRETVQGDLFANDTANTPFAALHVDRGTGFAEVGDTPVVLTGRYGTLTVNETGGYSYQPSATLAYSAVDLVDSFTYHLVQPNGATSVATLTVTIDVPGDGPATAALAGITAFGSVESDVIALDGAIAPGTAATHAPEATAVSLAAYDLFEGQGDLENVLTHYLATQTDDPHGAMPATDYPVSVMNSAMPAIADPLDYLVVSPEDHDRYGITTNHVV